ncbi:hypothetical protein GCM10023322_80060 [Rugosimonospora acidiphila]|uniref:DUF6596 domain-containing protein n=1 Tax=Rugosimonospora acidiphila TaxID=556531 RepID=A0ABP9STD8_9ACTN
MVTVGHHRAVEVLLHDARRPARVDGAGRLVALADQDRARWHRAQIDERAPGRSATT